MTRRRPVRLLRLPVLLWGFESEELAARMSRSRTRPFRPVPEINRQSMPSRAAVFLARGVATTILDCGLFSLVAAGVGGDVAGNDAAGFAWLAIRTSCSVIRPARPLPGNACNGTPSSLARRRTLGGAEGESLCDEAAEGSVSIKAGDLESLVRFGDAAGGEFQSGVSPG